MQELERVPNLRVLDVSNNRLTVVSGLETLQCLKDLWLNDNHIESLEAIEAAAREGGLSSTLTCLYINGNPAASQSGADLKGRMLMAFPKLEQLDDTMIT